MKETLLYAPYAYQKLSAYEKKRLTNGCGAGGWKIDLVPDTLYGLDVTAACNIHDYMYHTGLTSEAKRTADRIFLNNMVRLIDATAKKGTDGFRTDGFQTRLYRKWMRIAKKLLRTFRRRRAWIYYLAVKKFGGPAFWSGKNNPKNLMVETGFKPVSTKPVSTREQ